MTAEMAKFREKMLKTYGEGRVTRQEVTRPYDVIPTGSLAVDYALRVGGWVMGRMHEVVGPPQVGKSTLVLNSMAQAQRLYSDRAVCYIDMEQTFDPRWAAEQGLVLDEERLLHLYPDHSEHVSDMIRAAIRDAPISMVVVDSIGGMESKIALQKDAEDVTVGKNAQVITRMVKHCASLLREANATALLVNQLRANLAYGTADISAGPRALGYATTTKLALRRGGERVMRKIDGDDQEVSRQIKAKVERNKVAASGPVAEFWIVNQRTADLTQLGIDRVDEAATLGLKTGVINQRGSVYDLPGGATIKGKDKVTDYLRENPEEVERVRTEALASVSYMVQPEIEVVAGGKA